MASWMWPANKALFPTSFRERDFVKEGSIDLGEDGSSGGGDDTSVSGGVLMVMVFEMKGVVLVCRTLADHLFQPLLTRLVRLSVSAVPLFVAVYPLPSSVGTYYSLLSHFGVCINCY